MKKPYVETCATCFWWTPRDEAAESTPAECRRYPPAGGPGASGVSLFPVVPATAFCGEWEANEWEDDE